MILAAAGQWNAPRHIHFTPNNFTVGMDNRCSACISNDPKDFITKTSELPEVNLNIIAYEQFDTKLGRLTDKTVQILKNKTIMVREHNPFFKLTFLLDDFFNQEQITYSHRIYGYQNEWVEGKNNEVKIGRLPEGRFKLQIKGKHL